MKAVILLVSAGAVTVAWALFLISFAQWSEVFAMPRNIGGIALLAGVIATPGLILGSISARISKFADIRCAHCGHRERIVVRA